MTNCKYITKNGRCGLKNSYAYRHGCFGEDMCKCREPMTNADRIRAMNDEELRNWLFNRDCTNIAAFLEHGGMGVMDAVQLLEWLQNPAEGE